MNFKPTPNTSLNRALLNSLAFTVAAFSSLPSFAIDVSPGAYIPAPAGKTIAMFYLGAGEASEYDPAHGSKIDHDTRLKTESSLLRLFYMLDVSETRVQLQVGIPYGSQDLKLNGRKIGDATGFADPFVAVTAWPINDPEKKRYVGVTGYLYLPLGSYDNDHSLNMGSNRYATAAQVGYSETWGSWRADINADVTIYSDNDKSTVNRHTLKQDPTYVLQPWLSYTFPNKLTTSVGVTKTWGGASELNGLDTGRRTNSLRARLGVGYWVRPTTQLYGEFARDVEVTGGYKFDQTGFIRLTQVF
ncbi:transporter [Pseudomonas sp. NGC7]|uniref:transporter n=1 Tax=Pseudomonas sp. NGC7 TaxID=3341775 RepID=UPI0037DB90AE